MFVFSTFLRISLTVTVVFYGFHNQHTLLTFLCAVQTAQLMRCLGGDIIEFLRWAAQVAAA